MISLIRIHLHKQMKQSLYNIQTQKLHNRITDIKLLNRRLKLENNNLKKQLTRMRNSLKTLFYDDQIEHLTGNIKFPWISRTISQGLQIRTAVGKNGYEFVHKNMNYPLPSYRTLCQKVEVLQMASGIQQQVMELLALKTKK